MDPDAVVPLLGKTWPCPATAAVEERARGTAVYIG